jgi:2OG-Fe(II) oxygenase superfamily
MIGKRPAIASLSLGSTRKFKLRHKESGETVDYQLESGSLLIMLPGCQEDWVHAVPKTPWANESTGRLDPMLRRFSKGEAPPTVRVSKSLLEAHLIRLRVNARYPEWVAHQTVGHIPG